MKKKCKKGEYKMNRNRKALSKKIMGTVLAGTMALSSMTVLAEGLQEGQANEYTQANLDLSLIHIFTVCEDKKICAFQLFSKKTD